MKRTLLSVLGSAILVPTSGILVVPRARAILASLFVLGASAGIGVSPANAVTTPPLTCTSVVTNCDYSFDYNFTLGGGSVPFTYTLENAGPGWLDISVWADATYATQQPWNFTFGFSGGSLITFELKKGQLGVSFFIPAPDPSGLDFSGNWILDTSLGEPNEVFPVDSEIANADPHGLIQFTEDVPTGFSPASLTPLPASLPLFLGGLGVIGLFGARKKRKA